MGTSPSICWEQNFQKKNKGNKAWNMFPSIPFLSSSDLFFIEMLLPCDYVAYFCIYIYG